jgi:hypothetical protein
MVCRWIVTTTRHGIFLRQGIAAYCLSRWKTISPNGRRQPAFTAEAVAEKRGSMSQISLSQFRNILLRVGMEHQQHIADLNLRDRL